MTSNVIPSKTPSSVVLRRRSTSNPAKNKRIHGIVFDHPSMPKIMAVSSLPTKEPENIPTSPNHYPKTGPTSPNHYPKTGPIPPNHYRKTGPPALIHSPIGIFTQELGHPPACTPNDMSTYHARTSSEPSNLSSHLHTSMDHATSHKTHGDSSSPGYRLHSGKSTVTIPSPTAQTSYEYYPDDAPPGHATAMQCPGSHSPSGENYPEVFHMERPPPMVPPSNNLKRTLSYLNEGYDRMGHFEYTTGSRGTEGKRAMSYPVDQHGHAYFEDALGSRGPAAKRTMSYPGRQYNNVHFEERHRMPSSTCAPQVPSIDLNSTRQSLHFHQQRSVPISGNTISSIRHSGEPVPAQSYPAPQRRCTHAPGVRRMRPRYDHVNWKFHTDARQECEPRPTRPLYPPYIATMPDAFSPPTRTVRDHLALQHASTRHHLAQTLHMRRKSTGELRHVGNHDASRRTPEASNTVSLQPKEPRQYYEGSRSQALQGRRNAGPGSPPALVKTTRSLSYSEGPYPTVHRHRTFDSAIFYKELLTQTNNELSVITHPTFKPTLHGVTSRDVSDNHDESLESPKRRSAKPERRSVEVKPSNNETVKVPEKREVYVISDSDDESVRSCSPSGDWDDDNSDVFVVSDGASPKTERAEVICELDQASRDLSDDIRQRHSGASHLDHSQRAGNERELSPGYSHERENLEQDVFCLPWIERRKNQPLNNYFSDEDKCESKGLRDAFVVNVTKLANECPTSSPTPTDHLRRLSEKGDKECACDPNVDSKERSNFDEHDIVRVLNPGVIVMKSEHKPRQNSDLSTTMYECDPTKSDSRSSEHAQENGRHRVPKTEPLQIPKIESRNGSSSPTYELGFHTHQLIKPTDQVASQKIKNERTQCGLGTGGSPYDGGTTERRETEDSERECVKCEERTYTMKTIHNKLLQHKAEEKTHCPSCDCPGTLGKRSDVMKPGKKPTGIVVGIKKSHEHHVREPLSQKTADVVVKDSSDRKSCSGANRIFGGFQGTDGKLGKGFGLLQFNVVEKVAGMAWGEDMCLENGTESRVKDITSQQWEAYSVKLEQGKWRTQCDHVTSGEGATMRSQQEPKVLLGDDVKDRVAFQKWRTESDVGPECSQKKIFDGRSDSEGEKCVEVVVSPSQLKFSKIELNVKNDSSAGLLGKQQVCNDVNRKRTSPHYENIVGRGGKMFFSEIGKRPRLLPKIALNVSRQDVGVNTENGNEQSNGSVGSHKLTAQLKVLKIANNVDATAKVEEQKSTVEDCAKETATKVASGDVTAKVEEQKSTVEDYAKETVTKVASGETRSSDKKPSKEKASKEASEKKEELTSDEWKDILVGRISQVRESIAIEETPWKTKNKKKVLEKLEQQLQYWEGSSPNDCAAFLARKLQFFQTVRHQYELMKDIEAQRNAARRTSNILDNERHKGKVLKEHIFKENLTEKKNSGHPKDNLPKKKYLKNPKEKVTKKISPPNSAKKERLSNKKKSKIIPE